MDNELFNFSKYTNWYFQIIKKAKTKERKKYQGVYYENHHIIPRALGGKNNKENLVLLTAREHFICHMMLPKICIIPKHKAKMVYALMYLAEGGMTKTKKHIYKSKIYEKLKLNYNKLITGINNPLYGISLSDDHKQKIAKTRKINGSGVGEKNPMYGKNHTKQAKQKMSKLKEGKYEGENNPMWGKSRPDLTKWNLENNVRLRVGQFDRDLNLIQVFDHAKLAADSIGAKSHRNINHLAKNYTKFPNRTVYGFKWRYVD
jgi:hypothetical protein